MGVDVLDHQTCIQAFAEFKHPLVLTSTGWWKLLLSTLCYQSPSLTQPWNVLWPREFP